jgi:hypothetical protein
MTMFATSFAALEPTAASRRAVATRQTSWCRIHDHTYLFRMASASAKAYRPRSS